MACGRGRRRRTRAGSRDMEEAVPSDHPAATTIRSVMLERAPDRLRTKPYGSIVPTESSIVEVPVFYSAQRLKAFRAVRHTRLQPKLNPQQPPGSVFR